MALIQNTSHSLNDLFSNAENSPFCAQCAIGASHKGILTAQGTHGAKAFWASFKQDLSFWRSLVRFLFTVRTEDQIGQLLERLNHCSCRMNDPKILGYHRRGRFVENELLKRTGVDVQTPALAFIILFFCHLGAALDTAHLKAVAKRTAGDWPTCPQDLMPFGPESLIVSFIMWSRFIPDIMVFNVAAQCIRFCGSLLVPSAIESALTRHVIDAGRQLFDRTVTTIRLRAETRRAAMGRAFTSQVEMLLGYFNHFYDQQYTENRMKIMDGIEVKAVQVFSLLCYVADDPRLFLQSPRILRTRLAQHGLEIYINMERYLDPLPSILLYPGICALNVAKVNNKEIKAIEGLSRPSDGPEKDMALTFFDQGNHHLYISMAEMAISHIRVARFDLYCSARNCPNSIQSTGRQFQRCARCNVAVYCGKKCQIDAWSAQQYPHRKICKILQSLVAIAGSELLFLCPRSADPTYYPQNLSALVIKNWKQARVAELEFLQISGWGSYRMLPSVLPTRAEHAPGFADYEEQLTELTRREGALPARYLVLANTAPAARLHDEMRIALGQSSEGYWTIKQEMTGDLEGSNDPLLITL